MNDKFLKSAFVEKLVPGECLSLGMNRVKDGKMYGFCARLDGALSEGQVIYLCHGYMISYGRWLEISERELKICNFTSWANPQLSEKVFEHGLNIKNFVKVDIVYDTESNKKQIVLSTDGGEYAMGAGHWSCCDGEIAVKVDAAELYDVSLGFSAIGYSHDIWVIGASYLSLGDPARWPYYWYLDGGAGPLLIGRGGMGAQHGIEDFKDALKYGTPKILMWDSVSGNNPDRDNVLNPLFYENTLEMLKICKEKGIKVYIQTMPNCPLQTNMYKNDVILNRTGEFANYDYEIVDLARALDAKEEKNPAWFDNMLHTDNVHPTRIGGRASYLAIACDAPELIVGKSCKVYSSAKGTLTIINDGERLTLSAPERLGAHTAMTFRADFDNGLSGKITIGSESGSSLVIDSDTVKVYRTVDDKKRLVLEVENPADLRKLINVKIDVKGEEASVSLMSAGEKNYEPTKATLDIFKAPWNFDGQILAEADGVKLTEARIKLVTV